MSEKIQTKIPTKIKNSIDIIAKGMLRYTLHYCGKLGLETSAINIKKNVLIIRYLNKKREVKRQWRKTEYVQSKLEKVCV